LHQALAEQPWTTSQAGDAATFAAEFPTQLLAHDVCDRQDYLYRAQ
jgi:hypothetical protein